jgi:hypothetical protein
LLIRVTTTFALVWLILVSGTGANARGTATITKTSGIVKTYQDVRIHVLSASSLRISSADGRGSLTVDHAACSFAGELQRCLPYQIMFAQDGKNRPVVLERGTLYLNTTDTSLPLPHSTRQVPPHSIMLALRTGRGTLISVIGRIDGVAQ